jgi:16S rRNA A1518/A1519 N6-dimethyltransferase RsmA/KsgA/DIM1 with predicted DNA glycosylase/AP lyase activity
MCAIIVKKELAENVSVVEIGSYRGVTTKLLAERASRKVLKE